VVQPISKGDGQTVSLGDVSNSDGTSAKFLPLDKTSYEAGDSAQITLQDSDANVDPKSVNTAQVFVGSNSDDPSGQFITLTETAQDSGVFTGTFTVSSDQSKNNIFYDSGHPRAKAVFDGVTKPGAVEVKELPVSSFQEPAPDTMIGNGVQVSSTGGAELGPGDSTTVTLSYATAPANQVNGQESAIVIWEWTPEAGWHDTREFGALDLNQGAKTVTGTSTLSCNSGCVFVLGFNTGGLGGGGGGFGLPGAGIILDIVAPLVAANPEPPTTTNPPSSTDVSLSTESTATTTDAVSQPVFSQSGSANTSTTQESVKTAEQSSQNTGTATVSSTGNTTIIVPGSGNVVISFTKLGSDGTLSVSAVKTPSELSALQIAMAENGQGTLMTVDNTPYSIAGNVFMVGPLDSKFDGTATITIPYNATLAPQASEVKILHSTGSSWEDVTTSPPADGHVVTGSLSSLGPVVAAIKSQ
jgi:hypothetical protein